MLLRVPKSQLHRLREALAQAGDREIGGQIFGEQLAPSCFLVSEMTIQRKRGAIASFIVDLVQATKDAMFFFDRTDHQYVKFNYIGEWHSHPNFSVYPSGVDIASMVNIVADSEFQGNFAVLVIARLEEDSMSMGGWVFSAFGGVHEVDLECLS